MIFKSEEERIAVQYFSTVNNMVGSVAIAVGVSILHSKQAQPLAWAALLVFSLWAISQAYEYNKMLSRAHPAARPDLFMVIRHCWLFLVSIGLFAAIAVGLLTHEMFA